MRSTFALLSPDPLVAHARAFAAAEPEGVVNDISDAEAPAWLVENMPRFDCPDADLAKIYAYRWWTYRKHIKATPAGRIVTEFILPVRHAAGHNAISCALGHHLAEGRWLADQSFLDEYVEFWFTAGEGGGPEPKFHFYSSWLAAALVDRAGVTGDWAFVEKMFDDLVADFAHWKAERQITDGPFAGLYWQYDVRDGMEESITGSRRHANARPTISTYMFANARALATIARRLKRDDAARHFDTEAAALKALVQAELWDASADFFKAVHNETNLSDAREAIGLVPWAFRLPDAGYESAWNHVTDAAGFWAPAGLTTAERRHRDFRTHGTGRCEWDGPCWPFATSQTIDAMANVVRHYPPAAVTRRHVLDAIRIYAKAHRRNGHCYVGEYHDEVTGEWLKGDHPRGQFYNHSTFCDLVLHHLAGVVPGDDGRVTIDPLLPNGAWPWFCVDGVSFHGRRLTVMWDVDGSHYGRGPGLRVLADGVEIGHRNELGTLRCDI